MDSRYFASSMSLQGTSKVANCETCSAFPRGSGSCLHAIQLERYTRSFPCRRDERCGEKIDPARSVNGGRPDVGRSFAGADVEPQWNGNWGVAGNWTPASVPNGIGASASLLNVITAPRTVSLNVPVTLGNLTFGGNFAYTIGGTNTLTFDVAAGNATLNVGGTAAHTISRPIVLNDTLVINQGSSGILTLSGARSGTGGLIKSGTGTLTLSGANTYSGGTTVSAGTLQGNTTSLQGGIVNNAAVIFNQTAAGTYAGAMSGTGSLTKIGAGTLTLSGANTYSGGTTRQRRHPLWQYDQSAGKHRQQRNGKFQSGGGWHV